MKNIERLIFWFSENSLVFNAIALLILISGMLHGWSEHGSVFLGYIVFVLPLSTFIGFQIVEKHSSNKKG